MGRFSSSFLCSTPQISSTVDWEHSQQSLCIPDVLDTEENIWSPKYGLKGKLDASVRISHRPYTNRSSSEVLPKLTAPFELKTGKPNVQLSHRAQVIMYTLMMSDRYDEEIDRGLLLYLASGDLHMVPVRRGELRPLVMKRNELASYLKDSSGSLPAMLQNDEFTCRRCFSRNACFLYHKAIEDGTAETSGLGDVFDENVIEMTEVQKSYFSHWNNLLDLETGDAVSSRREIWTIPSDEREKLGRCFGSLQIVSSDLVGGGFVYTLQRSASAKDRSLPLSESAISLGDRVILSSECGKIHVNSGSVVTLTERAVAVQCGVAINEAHRQLTKKHFRVDLDSGSSTFGSVRYNLMCLFLPESEGGNTKLRQLVVDLVAPTFLASPGPKLPDDLLKEFQELNVDQQRAIEKVLCAKDYALVLGMPGTGKSTTIVFMVRVMVALGMRVLLTSYTHSAVDNLLLKLLDSKTDFLRVGRLNRVNIRLHKFCLSSQSFATVGQLGALLSSKQIIATTCLSITNSVFDKLRFDMCVVDEASQITQPTCLGPLRFCARFTLVGDHYQLPPLVRSVRAREAGMDVSLFRRLCEARSEAVVSLSYQYRMNSEILALSNRLVYNGQLKCGSAAVATSRLAIPRYDLIGSLIPASTDLRGHVQWLKDAVDPQRPVVFLNTDKVPATETRVGSRVGSQLRNEVECALVFQVVDLLSRLGVGADSVGVISPYRSQLKVLRDVLSPCTGMLVDTVDRFQGKDRNCVIISFVRSNADGKIGALLKDWRRPNVALTRAKNKLIMIGSRSTLINCKLYADLFGLLESRGWVVDLPLGAHTMCTRYASVVNRVRDGNYAAAVLHDLLRSSTT
eukprot:944715_1